MHKPILARERREESTMLTEVIGVDIAESKFDVCLVRNGKGVATGIFENTPQGFRAFRRWAVQQKAGKATLCMEATNIYWEALAQFAYDKKQPVVVVNPAQAHYFINSFNDQKDDPSDAERLGLLAVSRPLPTWTPPPPERRELRALVRRRDDLLKMRLQEQNRLDTADAVIQPLLQRHLRFLDAEIANLETQMRLHVNRHPDLKTDVDLVDSIKGIAFISAAMIVGELLDYRRFASADALAAYAGLVPRRRRSGKGEKAAKLSKRGNPLLRRALYFPAVVARHFNPLIIQQNQRLEARGLNKMQCIGAAMRKLLVLVYGVLKSRQPFRPDFAFAPQVPAFVA